MLQNGLLFSLGFLCAALLALMVAPAIWRRAVMLTRQRIESSVPLTLNEIQADKDQLRAEFAMSTRRLEISLEQLKERAAEQLIEINRRRDNVMALEEQQRKKVDRISELEEQADELRNQMKEREEKLNATTLSLANAQMQLEEKSLAFDELSDQHRKAIDEFDGQKLELIARETRVDTQSEESRSNKRRLKETASELSKLQSELKVAHQSVSQEKNRNEALDERVNTLLARQADLEGRLERRDADIKRLRGQSSESGTREQELEKELDQAHTDKVRLEAELAQAALRMESVLRDASGENIESAMAIFENERNDLKSRIGDLTKERDQLKSTLSAVEMNNEEDWETERRENAIVRERINDLAAKVTALTADIEGPDSPIHDILKKEKVSSEIDDAVENVNSLADRIRALQSATEQAS